MYQASDDVVRDSECARRLAHRQPLTVLFRRSVRVDLVFGSEGPHALASPRLPLAGAEAHSVQRGCDMFIGPPARHAAYHCLGLVRSAPPVFTSPGLTGSELRMLTTLPMDLQHNLARRFIEIGDDLLNQGPYDPLARSHGGRWRIPRALQIVSEIIESVALGPLRG